MAYQASSSSAVHDLQDVEIRTTFYKVRKELTASAKGDAVKALKTILTQKFNQAAQVPREAGAEVADLQKSFSLALEVLQRTMNNAGNAPKFSTEILKEYYGIQGQIARTFLNSALFENGGVIQKLFLRVCCHSSADNTKVNWGGQTNFTNTALKLKQEIATVYGNLDKAEIFKNSLRNYNDDNNNNNNNTLNSSSSKLENEQKQIQQNSPEDNSLNTVPSNELNNTRLRVAHLYRYKKPDSRSEKVENDSRALREYIRVFQTGDARGRFYFLELIANYFGPHAVVNLTEEDRKGLRETTKEFFSLEAVKSPGVQLAPGMPFSEYSYDQVEKCIQPLVGIFGKTTDEGVKAQFAELCAIWRKDLAVDQLLTELGVPAPNVQ